MSVAIGIAIGFPPPKCVKPRCVKALGSERLAPAGRFRGEGLKGGSELTRLRPRTLLEVFSELDARSRSLGGRCSRRVAHSGLRASLQLRPPPTRRALDQSAATSLRASANHMAGR